MTGEIIEVCQDCGHLIEVEVLTAPWGARYQIMMCQRFECISNRMHNEILRRGREDIDRRVRWGLTAGLWSVPVVVNPAQAFRVTGV